LKSKGGLQGRRYGKKEGEWVGKKKVQVSMEARLGKVSSARAKVWKKRRDRGRWEAKMPFGESVSVSRQR
jgi:hypothetical protein